MAAIRARRKRAGRARVLGPRMHGRERGEEGDEEHRAEHGRAGQAPCQSRRFGTARGPVDPRPPLSGRSAARHPRPRAATPMPEHAGDRRVDAARGSAGAGPAIALHSASAGDEPGAERGEPPRPARSRSTCAAEGQRDGERGQRRDRLDADPRAELAPRGQQAQRAGRRGGAPAAAARLAGAPGARARPAVRAALTGAGASPLRPRGQQAVDAVVDERGAPRRAVGEPSAHGRGCSGTA